MFTDMLASLRPRTKHHIAKAAIPKVRIVLGRPPPLSHDLRHVLLIVHAAEVVFRIFWGPIYSMRFV
jgi:hypothetical protein